MEDLPTKKGQEEAKKFFEHFCWCVEQKQFEPCYLKNTSPKHVPISVPAGNSTPVDSQKDVVIITDATPENTQIHAMISILSLGMTSRKQMPSYMHLLYPTIPWAAGLRCTTTASSVTDTALLPWECRWDI